MAGVAYWERELRMAGWNIWHAERVVKKSKRREDQCRRRVALEIDRANKKAEEAEKCSG